MALTYQSAVASTAIARKGDYMARVLVIEDDQQTAAEITGRSAIMASTSMSRIPAARGC